ncbi:MAG: hypothetical protein ABIV06_12130 [Thermoanaerobaculia bacterium]
MSDPSQPGGLGQSSEPGTPSPALPPSFAFGRFQYDGAQARLLLAGREVTLSPRVLHLLVIFLDRPGEWLDEEWVSRGLWPKAVPPTGELDRLVRELTAALDEGADGVSTIQKVSRRGYRLIIPVRPLAAAGTGAESSGARSANPPSGERMAATTAALPGGRSAHRALLSPAQIAAALLGIAAVVLAGFWLSGPPAKPSEAAPSAAKVATDPAAMRAAATAELGKGLAAAPLYDFNSRRAAISHFEAALQLDPAARNQATAHAALANVLVLEGEMERARLEAQAALAASIPLGPEAKLAEPLAALAFSQLFAGRDPAAARSSADRVLALDALHVAARRALVWVCVLEGRFDDALQQLGPARLPGHFDPEIATDEAWILYLSGRPLEARQLLSAIVRQAPLFRRAHAALAALHLSERRLAAAAVEFELLDAMNAGATGEDERVSLRISGSWALPDSGEAVRLLEERAASQHQAPPGGVPGAETEAARIYAQFGKRQLAIEALSRALERRESDAALARVDPAFAALRSSAAFRKLLDSAGVPPLVSSMPTR